MISAGFKRTVHTRSLALALTTVLAACGSNVAGGSGGTGAAPNSGTGGAKTLGTAVCDGTYRGVGAFTVTNNSGATLAGGANWSFSGDKTGASGGYSQLFQPAFLNFSAGDTYNCPITIFMLKLYGTPSVRSYKLINLNDMPTDGTATVQYRETSTCLGEQPQSISGWGSTGGTARIDSWDGHAVHITILGALMTTAGDVPVPGLNKGTGSFQLDGTLQHNCVQ